VVHSRAMTSFKPVIEVDQVVKVFRTYATPADRLRKVLRLGGRFLDHAALAGVSLRVAAGEAVGIIGQNGAGKTTLLKVVTGTTAPTLGRVEVRGRLASILELGAGFHPEFNGRDNAQLYGAMLGLDAPEMRGRMDTILEFAELGPFIDHPVKSYSTGMAMRLAFAVATHVDADILVVDEALAVGDGYFQKKCVDRILEIKAAGTTVLFCSHAMYHVSMFCDRAVWLEQGVVRQEGGTKEVVEAYEAFLLERGKRRLAGEGEESAVVEASGTRVGRVVSVQALGPDGAAADDLSPGTALTVEIEVESIRSEEIYHVGIALDTVDGRCVLGVSSLWDGEPPLQGSRSYTVRLTVPELPIAAGVFNLSAFLLDETGLHVHDQVVVPRAVRVSSSAWTPSLLSLPHDRSPDPGWRSQ